VLVFCFVFFFFLGKCAGIVFNAWDKMQILPFLKFNFSQNTRCSFVPKLDLSEYILYYIIRIYYRCNSVAAECHYPTVRYGPSATASTINIIILQYYYNYYNDDNNKIHFFYTVLVRFLSPRIDNQDTLSQ